MAAQLSKPIKPRRIKVDQVRLNLLNAMRSEARAVKRELEKTTATWKGSKPTFKFLISLKGGDAVILIGPGGNIKGTQKWVWLDEGTEEHPIEAKNAPFLVFRDGRGFTPKTKVRQFSSGVGASTGAFVSKKEVTHPGIDAREWSIEIVKLRKNKFSKSMIKAAKF